MTDVRRAVERAASAPFAVLVEGESGCGKSTLALTLMGLEAATGGTILFEGRDITRLEETERKKIRQRIQMVFQDPYESLNPTQTVEERAFLALVLERLTEASGKLS